MALHIASNTTMTFPDDKVTCELRDNAEAQSATPGLLSGVGGPEEKKLLRKIDLHLLVCAWELASGYC